ncbi:hypothetical protein EVAR_40800_1 [Eumeta japonica]|uniref:Uncharacterized protein n=1 Tax=Eumeta variegata TaxID=151549 RepID=A0A4C1X482_EUMVA|nr:hypothetical protein EVAR_40800_1 [Eumeta japonica]
MEWHIAIDKEFIHFSEILNGSCRDSNTLFSMTTREIDIVHSANTKFHLHLFLRQIGGNSLTLREEGGGDGLVPVAGEVLTLTVICFGAAIVVFVTE